MQNVQIMKSRLVTFARRRNVVRVWIYSTVIAVVGIYVMEDVETVFGVVQATVMQIMIG